MFSLLNFIAAALSARVRALFSGFRLFFVVAAAAAAAVGVSSSWIFVRVSGWTSSLFRFFFLPPASCAELFSQACFLLDFSCA